MPRRRVTVVSQVDERGKALEFANPDEFQRRSRELSDKHVEPYKKPTTFRQAVAELVANVRWGFVPRDGAEAVLLNDLQREKRGLVERNVGTARKRSRWQALAEDYFARHPNASKSRAAQWIKDQHGASERADYIAKRITKPK